MQPVLALARSSDDKYLIAGGGSTELSFVTGNDSDFLNRQGDASPNCTVSKVSLKGTGKLALQLGYYELTNFILLKAPVLSTLDAMTAYLFQGTGMVPYRFEKGNHLNYWQF